MVRIRIARKVELKPAGDKEQEQEESSLFIPDDVVLAILSYLPVRSLLRFKFVSKQWSCLISSITTQKQKIIIPLYNENHLFQSIDEYLQVEEIEIVPDKKLARQRPYAPPDIHGSCYGFLLVRFGIYLFLWNPSIRRSLGMLQYKKIWYDNSDHVVAGLCCDTSKDEYKVVLVLNYSDVSVGSFKTKSWSKVDIGNPRLSFFSSGPFVNNYLHMWCDTNTSYMHMRRCQTVMGPIVYFDPKMDKFENLPTPDLEQGEWHELLGIGILDGCICVTRGYEFELDVYRVKVWGMRQHGVKDSWEVLFKFECHPLIRVQPLQFTGENKSGVLMNVDRFKNSTVVAYDLNSKLIKEIANGKLECDPFLYEETTYKRGNRGGSKQVWRFITEKKMILQDDIQVKDSVSVLEKTTEEEELALRRLRRSNRSNRFSLLGYVSADEDYSMELTTRVLDECGFLSD